MQLKIIGSGPSGLFLSILLRLMGVEIVEVYDERVGHYKRPGALNLSAFEKTLDLLKSCKNGAQDSDFPELFSLISKNKNAGSLKDSLHIKDFEKALYAIAKRLGVIFVKTNFKHLSQSPKPGMIIATEEEKKEEKHVDADLIFDCTGKRRQVVQAVNAFEQESPPPMQLKLITEVPIREHFIAYVSMDYGAWYDLESVRLGKERFYQSPIKTETLSPLHGLGWQHYTLPYCYGHSFTKGRICLYMEAPDNLDPAKYDAWVRTVVQSYNKDATYTKLPETPGKPKPRFNAFSMSAEKLEPVAYQGKNLPMVLAMGDGQIDFNYRLAHGIEDGISRIYEIIPHLTIRNGEVQNFDADAYMRAIEPLMKQHANAMIAFATKRKNELNLGKDLAEREVREKAEREAREKTEAEEQAKKEAQERAEAEERAKKEAQEKAEKEAYWKKIVQRSPGEYFNFYLFLKANHLEILKYLIILEGNQRAAECALFINNLPVSYPLERLIDACIDFAIENLEINDDTLEPILKDVLKIHPIYSLPNRFYDGSTNPLHKAIESQRSLGIIKILKKNNISIYFRKSDGASPLELAIQNKRIDLVEYFMDKYKTHHTLKHYLFSPKMIELFIENDRWDLLFKAHQAYCPSPFIYPALDRLQHDTIAILNFYNKYHSNPLYKKSNNALQDCCRKAIKICHQNPENKNQQLEQLKHDTFKHRHFPIRIIADFCLLISCLCGLGFLIGCDRQSRRKTFFFSHEETQRGKEFLSLGLSL